MNVVLDVKHLSSQFFMDEGIVRAVDDVSFYVRRGEAVGIVGESGSGKSVTAMSIVRLLEEPGRIVGGQVFFNGRDVLSMSSSRIRQLRGNGVAMIFQDPMTALNPVLTVGAQIAEVLRHHLAYDRPAARDRKSVV